MERRIEPLAGQKTSLDRGGVIRKDVSNVRSGAACMEIVRVDDLCIRYGISLVPIVLRDNRLKRTWTFSRFEGCGRLTKNSFPHFQTCLWSDA
jgi:hypothetical protein